MPKRGRTCIYLPRRKEGEDPNAPRHISISYEILEGHFHLPLKDAAREIGLCVTTFKKACRRFDLEQWPYRMKHGRIHFPRSASHTDGVDADIKTLDQEPVCAPAAPTLQTTGAHQANHAVTVSCTSPVCQDGAWDTSAFGFPVSPIASSSSKSSSVFSSAAPQGLRRQASMVIDTRSYGEASPAFEHKTFDAPSYIDTLTRGSVVIGVATTCAPPGWHDGSCSPSSSNVIASSELHRDCATPLKILCPAWAGPPQERSCIEAIMDYLDSGCYISQADVDAMLSNAFCF